MKRNFAAFNFVILPLSLVFQKPLIFHLFLLEWQSFFPLAVFSVNAFGQHNTYFLILVNVCVSMHGVIKSQLTSLSFPFLSTWRILLAKKRREKKKKKKWYSACIVTQTLDTVLLLKANICKLSPYVHFGKGDFSNLVSQAPLKQPHKATTNKFLLLNATFILQNYTFPKGLVEPFVLN